MDNGSNRSSIISFGFTLLETLVAILVLSIALAAIVGLAAQSLHSVSGLKQQTVAINLAHEGVELVRNVRDNNLHEGNEWDRSFCPAGLGGYPCDREIACWTDTCSGPLVRLIPYTGLVLKINKNTGLYSYFPETPYNIKTIYQRRIHFELPDLNNPSEVRYAVTVTWDGKSFTLTGTLNDWRPPSS